MIGLLSSRATSSSQTLTSMPTHGTLLRRGTASGVSPTVLAGQVDVPRMLAEVKRITGFSWEKIGGLVSCSRQTVYNWTQGEAIKPENVKQVVALHETITHIDRGSQSETAALLATSFGGRTIFDMITAGEFATARRLAGKGVGRPTARWTPTERASSGRLDHWTDRIAADAPEPADGGAGFDPGKPVKKAKLRIR
ncbi:hypothetical protein [Sinorhizobium americanum]|uniref:hypothetical protein n=1 Tax=Sinorhizobium americanum TaxID=194963 RepID=UPI001FD88847|nr:hypothetical protein [Sinorhizobium americanum]